MDHYITKIYIEKLRHLSEIEIQLDSQKRQHLLLTGKNGSGKTTLLLAIKKYLELFYNFKNEKVGIEIFFNKTGDIFGLRDSGRFITAFFPADRKAAIEKSKGVEDIRQQNFYAINATPGNMLLKYMVHLKTQQAYARNEGDMDTADKIQQWFQRFESALKILLDNDAISLEYDYKNYDFKINEGGRNSFSFNQLSDGYSSLIYIVSDLILRMERNWLLKDALGSYDVEGIVLIDELETHLHIELQKKILPFLTEFFPRIQFIVTTHSPYILSSISNAKCYDLEKHVELENLTSYSAEELAEGYFDTDEFAEELKRKLIRYQYLAVEDDLSEDERAERARLRLELKSIPQGMANEAREMFEAIENSRRLHGKD